MPDRSNQHSFGSSGHLKRAFVPDDYFTKAFFDFDEPTDDVIIELGILLQEMPATKQTLRDASLRMGNQGPNATLSRTDAVTTIASFLRDRYYSNVKELVPDHIRFHSAAAPHPTLMDAVWIWTLLYSDSDPDIIVYGLSILRSEADQYWIWVPT